MAILVLLLLLLALPYFLHRTQPTKELVVSVYDKTVPQKPALQHEGLTWFLTHHAYPSSEGTIFDGQDHYLGYHPDRKQPIVDLTGLDPRTDLLYITDTYGIYRTGEGFSRTEPPKERATSFGEDPVIMMQKRSESS